ncbi:MAG TPA: aldo/keto reductase, partial [Tepidisphaeraceae bacterium]|nr:aldo/keto reductase [Tepidisphaeraceae bacterium]
MSNMNTQTIGKSGLKSTRLAYGNMRSAGTWEPKAVTAEMRSAGVRAHVAALEAGYTLFDTADIYCRGVCEEILGQALREVSGMRERIVIATKCGIRFAGDPTPDAPHRYDFSAKHIVWSCEQSLRRIGIETIDLYHLHRPDVLMDPTEIAEAFDQLKRAG